MKALTVFFTCGAWWEVVSLGIRWFSRPKWYPGLAEVSHMGLEFEDEQGLLWVAESLGKEGWGVKRSHLDKRLARGKKVLRFPLSPNLVSDLEVSAAWKLANDWVGRKAYDHLLIAKLAARGTFLGRMLGRRVRNDTDQVDCSEGASLLLFGATIGRIDLRDGKRGSFGAVTPQSALERVRGMRLSLKGKGERGEG